MNKNARWQFVCLGLTTSGWLVSGYLWMRLRALSEGATVGTDVCSIFGGGCDYALLSPSTSPFGLHLPVLGLFYFAVLTFLIVLSIPILIRVAVFLAAGGVGASLVLTVHLFQLDIPVCFFCLLTHAVNIATFGSLLALQRNTPLRSAGEAVAARPWPRAAWLYLILAVSLGGAAETLLLNLPEPADTESEEILTAYVNSPVIDLLVEDAEATSGTKTPARLVVFSSFECPGCHQFAPRQQALQARFGPSLEIVFKHFPLSSECNALVSRDLQPHACERAYAAEAARNQDAFAKFHDRLFAADLDASDDVLREIAHSIGLDVARWEADRQSDEVKGRIERDTELGAELGLVETPSVFLNGRRVTDLRHDSLALLIEQAIMLSSMEQMLRDRVKPSV